MIFECEKSKILNSLKNISKVVPNKSTISQLENIKFSLIENELSLTGTNNIEKEERLVVMYKLQVNNLDNSKGEFTVNSKLFTDIIKNTTSKNITITINENENTTAYIKADSSEHTININSAVDYPKLPDICDVKNTITIKQKTLKSMIKQTIHSVSNNDIKPIYTGEYFSIYNNILEVSACDGRRLARRFEKIECQDNIEFVVPSKAMKIVNRILSNKTNDNCEIIKFPKYVVFKIGNYTIMAKLLVGEFMKVKDIVSTGIDNSNIKVIIKTKELLSCLKNCSSILNSKNRAPVKLNFNENDVSITCKSPLGSINEQIEIISSSISKQLRKRGLSLNYIFIGLNNQFLLDILKNIDDDEIEIYMTFLTNPIVKPVVIQPVHDCNSQYLIMPIHLTSFE